MDTQKYEAFIKTAQRANLKEAAEELGYTQAGLSYILKTLEEELDVKLFHRNYGHLHLTTQGKAILPLAHTVCSDQRRILTKIAELKNLDSGLVTVAAFTSVAIHWLPSLIKEFTKKHPKVTFDIRFYEDPAVLSQILANGEADCGFTILPDIGENFDKIYLKKDPLMIILAENHPLADAPFFPSSAMEEEAYISSGDLSEHNMLFHVNQVNPRPAMTLQSDLAVMAMVSNGFGYSIFSKLMLEKQFFPIIYKEPEVPFSREIGFALPSYETAAEATKAFIDFTKNWLT